MNKKLKNLYLIFYFNLYNLWSILGGLLWGWTTYHFLLKIQQSKSIFVLLYSVSLFTIYQGIKGLFGTPEMFRSYYRLRKNFQQGKIKKYILYDMNDFPCYSQVTKKLCQEFNIQL